MLKPKYKSLTEAVAEYRSLLAGMDESHPKDSTLAEDPVKKLAESFNRHTNVTTSGPTAPPKPLPPKPLPPKPMLEHAPLSRYGSQSSALASFRMLAGLDQRELLPWDAGRLGTTKSNEKILSEAGGFGTAGTGRTGSWGGYASGSPDEDAEPTEEP